MISMFTESAKIKDPMEFLNFDNSTHNSTPSHIISYESSPFLDQQSPYYGLHTLPHSQIGPIIRADKLRSDIKKSNYVEITTLLNADQKEKDVREPGRKGKQWDIKNMVGAVLQRKKKTISKSRNEGPEFKKFVKSFPSKEKTLWEIEDRLNTQPGFGLYFIELILEFLNDEGQIEEWFKESKLTEENKANLRRRETKEKLLNRFQRFQRNITL